MLGRGRSPAIPSPLHAALARGLGALHLSGSCCCLLPLWPWLGLLAACLWLLFPMAHCRRTAVLSPWLLDQGSWVHWSSTESYLLGLCYESWLAVSWGSVLSSRRWLWLLAGVVSQVDPHRLTCWSSCHCSPLHLQGLGRASPPYWHSTPTNWGILGACQQGWKAEKVASGRRVLE